jgi:hypothetical protein
MAVPKSIFLLTLIIRIVPLKIDTHWHRKIVTDFKKVNVTQIEVLM